MHEGLREQVARVVDPEAWEESFLPDGTSIDTEVAHIFADALADSLAKADEILSLVSKVSVPGGPTDAFHLSCPSCGQAIDLIPEQGSSRSQPEADKCSLTLPCSDEGAGGSGAALTREELIDLASDAPSDSIDMDWTPSVGARYVIDHLLAEGVIKA